MPTSITTYADTSDTAVEIRRLNAAWVNVKDFGATGNGSTDDTAAIQAAIDYALANAKVTVYLPAGTYKTTSPIYMDPPTELRASAHTTSAFSLHLKGDNGTSQLEQRGTTIRPVDNSFVGIWVGGGRGMKISDLSLVPASTGGAVGRKAYPQVAGIAYANYGSFSLMENVWVSYYYYGFRTGANGDPLTDSNTWIKCMAHYCYIGFDINATQNLIATMFDSVAQICTIGCRSNVGIQVDVFGGNWSTFSAERKKFTISGVSGLTYVDSRTTTFTATVSSPDTKIAAEIYDIGCINTTGYGLVPVLFVSYAAGVVTLQIDPNWITHHYGLGNDLPTETDLGTELGSATTLYMAERITTFYGAGFNVRGIHLENDQAVTCILRNNAGFLGSQTCRLSDIYLNYFPSHIIWKDSTGDNAALYYCQQAHAFIKCEILSHLILENWTVGNEVTPINIDGGGDLYPRITARNVGFINPRLRQGTMAVIIRGNPGQNNAYSRARAGFYESEVNPFFTETPHNGGTRTARQAEDWGRAPTIGYSPAPWTTPRVTPADVDATVAAPAFGDAPLMHGDIIYSVSEWNIGPQMYAFAKNAVKFYTLGADQTINWSYKARSPVVRMDDTSKMFPGLQIILNDGTSDIAYIVTGVWENEGYVTVFQANDLNGHYVLTSGAVGDTKTGATVKQERNRVRKYGRQCEFGTAAPTTGTWEKGDIVYATNVAAGGFLGWVCVTAGAPGTWKTFGAVTP